MYSSTKKSDFTNYKEPVQEIPNSNGEEKMLNNSIESIGITCNLSITFPPGFTIYEDYIVVRTPKPILLFPNSHLKKYKCAMDWDKDELKIPFNRKDHIIPVTMIKVKNKLEVNCATTTQDDKSSTSYQISQETDEDENDNVPFEK
jgi:hypothetical protein